MLERDDVDEVVNACDAGREGELIFRYIVRGRRARTSPSSGSGCSSMTSEAIRDALRAPAARRASSTRSTRRRAVALEADWIVGMNATRAATIRLRSSFDGAVSLGRVQTPTLAIIARREEEIRAFVPEPYWLVDAAFEPPTATRASTSGRYHDGAQPRLQDRGEADAIVAAVRGRRGEITKLETTPAQGARAAALRPDRRFSARPTRASASRRGARWRRRSASTRSTRRSPTRAPTRASCRATWSREIKPIAELRRPPTAEYAAAGALRRPGSTSCRSDASSTTRRSPTTTRSSRPAPSTTLDEVHATTTSRSTTWSTRRFLAVFHPDAVFENTRVETTVAEHVFRTRGKVLLEPGWRGVVRRDRRGRGPAGPRGRGGRGPRAASAQARAGRGGPDARGAGAGEGDPAAAALHRRLAAGRDGDGRQARRRRGAAGGDEGVGHRHAGHARRDHRAVDRGRLHRTRRPRARRAPRRGAT